MKANINTIKGKESDESLTQISNIAGLISGISSLGAGVAGGFNGDSNIAQKIGQVTSTVGSATSTASQTSSLIKKSRGKESGELESILSTIGSTLSTVGSLTSAAGGLAQKANDSNNTKSDNDSVDNEDSKTDETKQDDSIDKTKKDDDDNVDNNQDDDTSGNLAIDNNSATLTESDQNVADMEAQAQEAVDSVENPETAVDTQTQEDIMEAQTETSEEEQAIQQAEESQKQKTEQDTDKKLSTAERREERQTQRAERREARIAERQARKDARIAAREERKAQKAAEQAKKQKDKKASQPAEEEKSLDDLFEKTVKNSKQNFEQNTEQINEGAAQKWMEAARKNGSTIIEGAKGAKVRLESDGKNYICNGKTYTPEEINEILTKDTSVLFADNNTDTNRPDAAIDSNAPTDENPADGTQVDEVPAANLSEETETDVVSPDDETAEVPASTESDTNSDENPDESAPDAAVPSDEKSQSEIAAEKTGLDVGKSVNIKGTKYEITTDGRFLINGKETEMADFMTAIKNSGYINKNILDDMKAQLDEEMQRALSIEKPKLERPDALSTGNSEKIARQEKMNKVMEISSAVVSGGSQIMQTISSINSLLNAQGEDQNTTISLADMRKARALMRKIRNRRGPNYGYAGR